MYSIVQKSFRGGFTQGHLQYTPIAILQQSLHNIDHYHTTTGAYISSRQLWRQPYCTGGVVLLIHGQGARVNKGQTRVNKGETNAQNLCWEDVPNKNIRHSGGESYNTRVVSLPIYTAAPLVATCLRLRISIYAIYTAVTSCGHVS